jgi:signal transduction histidine kinase
MAATAKLEQTPAPDTAEQELRDFSYIVSHDLATEFRHIEIFSRQLLEIPEIRDNPSSRSYADIVLAASGRCRGMLDELRTYSRAQQSELHLAESDAHLLVGRALLQLSATLRTTKAKIAMDVRQTISVDSEWMMIAVREVIRNALQFARPGVPPAIQLRGSRSAEGWRLHVIDEGIGLDPAYWDKAFRMFWKLEPSRPSLGSGLAISRRIVRRHGGEIRFVPAPSGSTCVEITLPDHSTATGEAHA